MLTDLATTTFLVLVALVVLLSGAVSVLVESRSTERRFGGYLLLLLGALAVLSALLLRVV